MRIALGLAVVLVAALTFSTGEAAPTACETGQAQGFAAIRWSPQNIPSTIPPRFTKAPQFFWRRYNCTGRGVYVRRIDRGVYDISFPGLGYRLGIAASTSQEAIAHSVQPFGTGVFRVTVRGPVVESDLLVRRDAPFSIVIY